MVTIQYLLQVKHLKELAESVNKLQICVKSKESTFAVDDETKGTHPI